jgi:hypothetical protein
MIPIYNVIKTLHSCHPEQSEGSLLRKVLHYVQNDRVGFFGLRFFRMTDKGV